MKAALFEVFLNIMYIFIFNVRNTYNNTLNLEDSLKFGKKVPTLL